MVDAALIDGPMAAALAEHRERCNAVVARASRSYSGFDTAALERQLRGPVRDFVEACERTAPGSGARVLAAVFEPVVELVGQHRLGGGTHDDLLAALPRLARIVVEEPRRVFGSLANAVVHLGSAPKGAKVNRPEIHHDDTEVCWVTAGRIRLTLPHEIVELGAGDSIQFDAIQQHGYEALADSEFVILHLRKDKRY